MGTYVSTFANGMAFMFFIGTALHLSLNGYKTRTNLFLEILFSLLAMMELKELIPAFSGVASSNTENVSLFIDGLAVSACGLCLFELLRPGWNTVKRVVCLAVSYAATTVLCLVLPFDSMVDSYTLFAVLYLAMAAAIALIFMTSNKECVTNATFTTSTKKSLLLLSLFTAYMVLWITESMIPYPWINVIYKLVVILLWILMIEEYNRREEQSVATENIEIDDNDDKDEATVLMQIPEEKRIETTSSGMKDELGDDEETAILEEEVAEQLNADEQAFHFKKQLTKVMAEGKIYRNPRVTINDVANAVGTNRTYLSAYLNSVLHTTFYDYINGYRIEYISKDLLKEDELPGKTMDEIAELSGFNSTTTFRRAFQKKTGITPMAYRKEALKK
jgi:AraC-like DNA-binding protein